MKLWNKIALFGIACVMLSCIFPLQVKAGNILTAQATGQTTQVEVTGQVDTGVLAVVIQVRDSSDNILTMETFSVKSDSTYQATLQLDLAAGEYKVYVADFDGGDWKTADFSVTASTGGGTGGTGDSGSGGGTGGTGGSGSGSGTGGTGGSGSSGGSSNGSGNTGSGNTGSSGGGIGGSSNGSGSGSSGGNTNGSGNSSVGTPGNVEENSKDNTESSNPDDSNIGGESETKIPNEDLTESKSDDKPEQGELDADQDSDEFEALSENVRDSQDESSSKPWTIVLIIVLVIGLVLVIGGVVYLRNRHNDDI